MEMVGKALEFAQKTMGHKTRKGSGVPYMTHLYSVMGIVAGYGGEEVTRVAAVLHDCPEDAGISVETIRFLFGEDVAKIVAKLTEDKALSWHDRKRSVIDLAGKCCQPVGIVLIADKIDNLSATLREMPAAVDKEKFQTYWSRFNAPVGNQLRFHQDLVKSLITNERLITRAKYPDLRTNRAVYDLTALVRRFENMTGSDLWEIDENLVAKLFPQAQEEK